MLLILAALIAVAAADCPYSNGLPCSGPYQGLCQNFTSSTGPYQMCVCSYGYAADDCSYKQKKQLVAFLTEFFVGWTGVGYFYLGYNVYGGVQLMISFLPCVLACVGAAFIAGGEKTAPAAICFYVLIVLTFIAAFAWWLAAVIIFGIGSINDANGYPMASM